MRLTSYQNSKLIWFKILHVFLRIVGDITMFHFFETPFENSVFQKIEKNNF